MDLDIETVKKVAQLAKLKISDTEAEQFRVQLTAVLDHINHLERLDTESVEPLANVGDLTNALRSDSVTPSLAREAALQNAPKQDGDHLLVPPVFASEQK